MSFLVVCSKNRGEELKRLFRSLRNCAKKPDVVFLIDGSDEDKLHYLEELQRLSVNSFDLEIIRFATPGLVMARNRALDEIESRLPSSSAAVVHFVDDDVIFTPNYFHELTNAMNRSRLAGACGRTLMPSIPRIPEPNSYPRNPGRLSRFGIAVAQWTSSKPAKVEWLPGCSMSYRLDAIRGMRFDTGRQALPAGEDIEFSSRVASEVGPLGYVPSALIWHMMSDLNRPNPRRWAYEDVYHRKDLGRKYVHKCSPTSVLLGSIFMMTTHLLKGLNPRDPESRQRFIGTILGLVDFYLKRAQR